MEKRYYLINKIIRPILIVLFVAFSLMLTGCGTLVHHKVSKGDSLYSIGFYYGQDYQDIAQWNEISSPYVLHVGQWLRVVPPEQDWREEHKHRHRGNPKTSGSPRQTASNQKQRISPTASVVNQSRYTPRHQTSQAGHLTDNAQPVKKWLWPSSGKLMNPNGSFAKRKKGINITGKRGQAIRATAAGEVVYSGNGLIGYGKLIIVKHNKTYLSAYAHNDAMLVGEGDFVKPGQKIAKMGLTPDQQVLLHFEIRKNGKPVDPLKLLNRRN